MRKFSLKVGYVFRSVSQFSRPTRRPTPGRIYVGKTCDCARSLNRWSRPESRFHETENMAPEWYLTCPHILEEALLQLLKRT
ncbi:hypothetical protein PanWU01x14_189490 [Parasponia andersonii]|uniref:Uncharacterized protein n=1 Tax=Parasponia andersonii TaxID=3476 RepID=A0A2P5C2G7_PARAD|nr:hypothetical protein PanWU01x14_189490 [Parasponia andersonii]